MLRCLGTRNAPAPVPGRFYSTTVAQATSDQATELVELLLMKPNDTNGHIPPDKRPFRVLIISGSQRRIYNCPGVDSKSRALMLRMADRLPQDWEIDLEDLSNVYGRHQIQSCNACVSTSMALCVWPCNCYEKGSKKEPDLMWDIDLYARLDLADAWVIIGPVNWYGPTSNLKKMFDRLVCMNGGNPDETLIDHKDPEKAMALRRIWCRKRRWKPSMHGRTALLRSSQRKEKSNPGSIALSAIRRLRIGSLISSSSGGRSRSF